MELVHVNIFYNMVEPLNKHGITLTCGWTIVHYGQIYLYIIYVVPFLSFLASLPFCIHGGKTPTLCVVILCKILHLLLTVQGSMNFEA